MGLRDWLRRLGLSSRPRREAVRGRRRPRLAERRPDAPTAQMGAAPAAGPGSPPLGAERGPAPGAGPAPTERAPSLAPHSPQVASPEAAPPASASAGSGPPREGGPAPPPAAPAPSSAPSAPSEDPGATRYHAIPDAARPRVAGVLVAVDGELAGEVYPVRDGETRLGRSPDCEAVLQSEWISRHHARIRHQDGVFVIAPLSEKNPTVVNDEPTEGRELADGDFVRLGRTTLRFRSVL